MYIKKMELINFRNYVKQEIELGSNINILYGNNAQGKTNILEAIYLSAIGKSYRTVKDKELINKDKEFSKVEVEFAKKDREGKIAVNLSDKKIISVNDIKLKRMSEALGNINIVLFSPEEITIFKEGPDKRRRMLDIIISQLRPAYVFNLNNYMEVLKQRNNYLKQIKFENKPKDMLDVWDMKLAEYAEAINLYRQEFMKKIEKKIAPIHNTVTQNKEQIEIKYISNFESKEKFLKKTAESRELDIIKGFTVHGIHRDDIKLYINGDELGIYGSQGQHRSAILSIKLSELEIIKEEIEENPILLLDDFMSELDKERREKFLEDIQDNQVIITCTDKLELKNEKKKIFYVENRKSKYKKQLVRFIRKKVLDFFRKVII